MNNDFLLDPELSPQAKGTLAVILSNADTWRIYPEEIAKRSKSSKDATVRYFKELEEAGYMKVIRRSLGRGKGIKHFRFVSDVKLSDSYFHDYVEPRFEEWLAGQVTER